MVLPHRCVGAGAGIGRVSSGLHDVATCFVPLWVKTHFSFLSASSGPDELVTQAAALQLHSMAITDRDSLAGIVQAHTTAKELHDAQRHAPRLIYGAEIGACAALPQTGHPIGDVGRVVVLAQSRAGYANISRLISCGRLRRPKGESIVTWDEVAQHAQDCIALWTHHSGPATALATVRDAFGDRLYAGVARRHVADDAAREARQRELAEQFALPLVALPEILYHVPARRKLHDVLSCIRLGTTLDAAGNLLEANSLAALPDAALIDRLYGDQPDWIETSRAIAARCTFALDQIEYRYPAEKRPDGYDESAWLRRLTHQGAAQRYPEGTPSEVAYQLDRELDLIDELAYVGYFLTMYEIVRYCRANGILCQGRGSAANSAVCYCLGITAVDPVQMGLLFERFLSRERAEPPDIDLDIEHRRREEVIAHVYQRYGRDYAAMVANVVHFRPKMAIREVGKVFGLAETTLDRISKQLSHFSTDYDDTLERAGLPSDTPRARALREMLIEILEVPRHLSIHPGGFLLGRDPVATIVPIENATMEGRTVIQWDKYAVEDMGLFKVDLLGLGALTHLDYAFALLQRHLGVQRTLATVPRDCAATYQLLCRADTVGVFQVESRAQMSMLPRLAPKTFYDLVVEISIVRPGPITGGMVHPYLRRRNGEEEVVYPHETLQPVLAKTLGVPLFQEQVMKLAVVAADYTPGEADQLRRDMAAWRRSGRIEQHRERLVSRMTAKGIELQFAERVFDQIRGFGEYGFPESHAASFALIAYATSWVRTHYPVVFICALLNAWPMGFYSPATIIGDGRRHGVRFRPVDVLTSDWECTLEVHAADRRDTARRSRGPGDAAVSADAHLAIRIGLRLVKGLSEADAEAIAAARSELRGDSGAAAMQLLVRRAQLARNKVEALATAGAFDSFSVARRDAMWHALGLSGGTAIVAANARPIARQHQIDERSFASRLAPRFRHLDAFERVGWDYLAADHSTRAHPLEAVRTWLRTHGYLTAADLREQTDGTVVSYVGMVICRQRPETAGGTVFFTLEDETGLANLIVWQRRYQELKHVLAGNAIVAVGGVLQVADGGVTHLVVDRAWLPELPREPVRVESRDFR